MHLPQPIEINPDVMMGKPCIRGTRIPVYLILQKIAEGETVDGVLRDYPQLAKADIQACLQYAASLASEEIVLPAQ
jgi:uncharacterized protein (DUF433 family)